MIIIDTVIARWLYFITTYLLVWDCLGFAHEQHVWFAALSSDPILNSSSFHVLGISCDISNILNIWLPVCPVCSMYRSNFPSTSVNSTTYKDILRSCIYMIVFCEQSLNVSCLKFNYPSWWLIPRSVSGQKKTVMFVD